MSERNEAIEDRKVPALVVSGFLGSGKTTLIRHILAEATRRAVKVALVSNELGALGVDAFAAVIDPPGVATVAIGAEKERVTLVDGRPTTTTTMTATVSADRRVADEADAARWLDAFAAQFRRASRWTV